MWRAGLRIQGEATVVSLGVAERDVACYLVLGIGGRGGWCGLRFGEEVGG